jgi:ABC-type Fe3+/spermidine/putrescine transport system ATPase subunit
VTGLRADITASFTADGTDTFTVDAEFGVETGENLVVLGPSGSGKTLLLETVAGFHGHEGHVTRNGTVVGDRPPEQRDFGFVFQDYALFPHMTVTENVDYGQRYHDDTRPAEDLLAELGVAHLAERYPPTLSGGEKQRVALARALAIKPDVLLLDEPLAALDVPTRQSLRDDLADVLTDVTAVYVTHNRTTARALADRLAVMADGEIVQSGSVADVFDHPASPMVAEFTGSNALSLAEAPALREILGDGFGSGDHVAVRPEAVHIAADGRANGTVPATVERVVREDATSRVTVRVDGVTVEAFSDDPPRPGETVRLRVPPERVHRYRSG